MKEVMEMILNDATARDVQGVADEVRDVNPETQNTPWLW